MTLFVDTQHGHGHSGDLAPLLRSYLIPSSLVEETRLDFGDITFAGNGPKGTALRIGIEVKRVGDCLSCMEDGRLGGLGGQLEGMHRDYDLSWLVVEDELWPDKESGVLMKRMRTVQRSKRRGKAARGRRKRSGAASRMPSDDLTSGRLVPALYGSGRRMMYAALMKWLTSLQVGSIHEYGKPLFVWTTKSPDETAQWIVSQYRYWTEKVFEAHKSLRMFNTAIAQKNQGEARRSVGFMSDARKRRMGFANLFTGIGYDRALNLSGKFSSIEDMSKAAVEELMVSASKKEKHDAVTRKRAEKMWGEIRERRR